MNAANKDKSDDDHAIIPPDDDDVNVPSPPTSQTPFLTINDIPIYFTEDWNTGIGGGLWTTGLAMAKYFEQHAIDVCDNLRCLVNVKEMRLKNECVHQQLDDHQLTQLEGLSIDQYTSGEGCGIKALELGSGNGFLSVCFLALAQTIPLKELVVTDMADHLTLMAETLKRNSHAWDELRVIKPIDGDDVATSESLYKDTLSSDDATTQQSNVTVTVTEHQWGEFPTITNPNPTIEQRLQNQKYDFIFGSVSL
ncbi:predicted protein [Thalassiosira pseudonana CCMP1335]|uniref:Uncharacterized protein n=1 Tax=Thalassiosira pseudonana TaxID=35128 RepID=B8BYD6_THAPS|nr:predicted protein [Thalassiosira pseudonana CCMP1335]EED93870.1 predicted protein [Thalassiosira pseudonana CCMP1335]